MQDDWLRLEKVIKWTGLSVNSFARAVGLNRAENLYQIKKGNNGISRDLAFLISAKYPQISKGWVLTGEGNMFTNDSVHVCSIPYYDMDVMKIVRNPEEYQTRKFISVPMLEDADFAAVYYGEGMPSNIPSGATVVLKRETSDTIIPGRAYVVVCDKITLLRYIRRDDDSSRLRLVAQDRNMYDDVCIDESQIKDLYVVRGVIITKTA